MCWYLGQAFQTTILEEVKELSASPFGSTLVSTIGYVSGTFMCFLMLSGVLWLFVPGYAYLETASSELSTFDSFKVGLNQATRGLSIQLVKEGSEVYLSYVLSLNSGLSTSFSIAKEGIQAAYLANQVNKEREKRRKDVQEQR